MDSSLFLFPSKWPSFQQIKCCAFIIKKELGKLVELARKDTDIQNGVTNAHIELMLNMVKIVSDSASKLPHSQNTIPSVIDFADQIGECGKSENENGMAATP